VEKKAGPGVKARAAEAARESGAVLILTGWDEFRHRPWAELGETMKSKNIVDGCNMLTSDELNQAGFTSSGSGRLNTGAGSAVLYSGSALSKQVRGVWIRVSEKNKTALAKETAGRQLITTGDQNRAGRKRPLAENRIEPVADPGRPELERICFVITRADDLGGAQVHVLELASALKERGYGVQVLAGGGGVLFEALEQLGITCRKLNRLVHPIRPGRDLAALKELRRTLQELQPDLVTTHSNKAGFLGRLAARSLNIPVIHTSHGFLFNQKLGSPGGRFYRFMEKTAARVGDRVIAVAQSEFEVARKLGVIPAEKMAVVHNGLPDLGKAFRSEPGQEPPRLVMVARFAAPKDHETLFKSLAGLTDKQWTLDLVGDGPGLEKAKELAGKLGLSERVTFLGHRGDVPQVLAGAQVFILSSRREGFPLSILEAMRAGLPVVAARAGGIPEAVSEGESGLLFPPGESGSLKEHLERLIDNPLQRRVMGEVGRKRFEAYFNLDQMVEKTLSVYESLI